VDVLNVVTRLRGGLYRCGQVARALQGRVQAEEKEPDSPHQESTAVTLADRLCQEVLLLEAHEVAPGIEVYSEEMGACPPEILALFSSNHHRYALILDPIDGTDDYVGGRPTYAHMVGLLDQPAGVMAASLIYFPEMARLYVGVRGMGAYCADGLWGDLRPLAPAAVPRTVGDVKRLTASDREAFQRLGVQIVPPQSASAAYELMRVARGDVGAMVMRHFHGHDMAIPGAIIQELGGAVLDGAGEPARFEKGMPRMPLVVLSLSPDYAGELVNELER
jgi:fructose-1,6-bisphosphatase/inositol monophosphatase family enzyme